MFWSLWLAQKGKSPMEIIARCQFYRILAADLLKSERRFFIYKRWKKMIR